MKITKAETRIDEGWKRLFVTIDGAEFLIPVAKAIFLAQGMTYAPEFWPYELQSREIFHDLADESSPSEHGRGITDPILVGIAIRVLRSSDIGPIPIPNEADGVAEIEWIRKHHRG